MDEAAWEKDTVEGNSLLVRDMPRTTVIHNYAPNAVWMHLVHDTHILHA